MLSCLLCALYLALSSTKFAHMFQTLSYLPRAFYFVPAYAKFAHILQTLLCLLCAFCLTLFIAKFAHMLQTLSYLPYVTLHHRTGEKLHFCGYSVSLLNSTQIEHSIVVRPCIFITIFIFFHDRISSNTF